MMVRLPAGLVALCVALGCAQALHAAPIKSILIDHVSSNPPPLEYTYDPQTGEGELSITIDSFTAILTRTVGTGEQTEFIQDASFQLHAGGLVDFSMPPLAMGLLDSVEFELWAGQDLLLAGEQSVSANLGYGESIIGNLMFISGGPVDIVGGSLAAEFDVAARLFGMGLLVSPGTGDFDELDTDHAGSVKLKLLPVPEPTSLFLGGLTLGWLVWRGPRNRCLRSGR